MPPKRRRAKPKKKTRLIVLILLLIAAGIFLVMGEFGKEKIPEEPFVPVKPTKIPELVKPEPQIPRKLPRVAVVIDDLGINRKLAEQVIALNSPLTLSILPGRRYSKWIADEGSRAGLDIIVHLPMEASTPHKLGEGGLYLSMNNSALRKAVVQDLRAVPHIKGASNHMGSAFTKDKRVMRVVMAELKKQRLFFLDSLTTPDSVGYDLARSRGLKAFRRDVFLDNTDNLQYIEIQWNRLVRIAKKRGYAIALAHPKKNTLIFLKKVLKNNKEVQVVPITELLVPENPLF